MISDNLGANVAYAAMFNGEQDVYFLRTGPWDCNGNEVPDEDDITSARAMTAMPTTYPTNANTAATSTATVSPPCTILPPSPSTTAGRQVDRIRASARRKPGHRPLWGFDTGNSAVANLRLSTNTCSFPTALSSSRPTRISVEYVPSTLSSSWIGRSDPANKSVAITL